MSIECRNVYAFVKIGSDNTFLYFLPARRYALAGVCESNVSVRLSVTRRYGVKT